MAGCNATRNGSSRFGDDHGYAETIDQATKCLQILRLYLAPTLTAICIIGSAMILYSAANSWRTLKPKYYVLVVLTVADCVTILSSAFFNQFLHYGLGAPMPHVMSNVACKLWSLLWIFSNGLSTNLLCFLAMDRLYAVGKPLSHLVSMTQHRYFVLLGVFCLPFLAAAAFGVGTFRTYEYLGQRHCYISVDLPHWMGITYQVYTTLMANGIIGSCFLLVANAILACRICVSMRNSNRYRPRTAGPREKRGETVTAAPSQSAVRSGVTLMAASVAHLIGSLPRAVTYLIAAIVEYGGLATCPEAKERQQFVFLLASCFDYLFFANCSLNWLIYCAQVPQLRPW